MSSSNGTASTVSFLQDAEENSSRISLRIRRWTSYAYISSKSALLSSMLMLQEVLAEDQWKNPMKQEDWRGLTPLFYQHVNPYGRFTLDLTQRLPLSLTNIA